MASDRNSDPGLGPLTITSAWEQVADALREAILLRESMTLGRLPAEEALAAQLAVSRGTLRRALRQLAEEGLVESKRGADAGTYVVTRARVSRASTLATVLETRRLLELPAAAEAARLGRADRLVMIESIRREALDGPARFAAHRAFHEELLRLGATPLCSRMADPIFGWLGRNIDRDRAREGAWAAVDCDHEHIIKAIHTRDAPAAVMAMSSHLNRMGELYVQLG